MTGRRTFASWALPLSVASILALAAYLGVGLLVAARLSTPAPEPVGPAPPGLAVREVAFKGTDGVPLSAWWVPPPGDGPARATILVHGWGGNRSDEYIRETAPLYTEAGYGVLMLDLRGHGSSGGERRTLGYKEVRDVRGALSWLEGEGYEPGEVVLHGWSMGGATVVRSAPGTGVAAIVEEAGYADLLPLLDDQLPRSSGLPRAFNLGAYLAAKLFLDFDPWAVRPEEDASRLREENIPFYIIHSTDDRTVPYDNAKLFARANPDARLWTLRGYEHVEAYKHPEYGARLSTFLDSVANRGPDFPGRPG